jgi:hypothetical protein
MKERAGATTMPDRVDNGDPLGLLLAEYRMNIAMPFPRSECPRGWLPAVEDLLRELRQIGWREIEQVKEKFGGLRVYLSENAPASAHAAVEKAAERCSKTCEECGQPGQLREHLRWMRSLCTSCLQTVTRYHSA